jgi:CSLREA domain-containing protein
VRECRIVRGIWLGALSGLVVACQPDAALAPVAPSSPALSVSSNGTWLVNSLADPGDGLCTNNECTLREAIAAAQIGERITFKSNLSGTIALTAGALIIDKSLTIEARDAHQVTVDARNGSAVIWVNTGGIDALVNIIRLTITGGSDFDGAGIDVTPGNTLNLIGSVVRGNTANYGGAISVDRATVRIVGSTISGNTATTGAGGGIYASSSNLTVSRSTISGNGSGLEGGGIAYTCSISSDCLTGLIIRSSTITKNDAPTGGGLHMLNTGPASMANTIVAGNTTFGSPVGEADCNAFFIFEDFGYNLSIAGTGCALISPTDVILPFAGQVFVSVLLPLLAENGGGTPTHALIERGLAVDRGSCPGENGDQRGFPRPFDDLRMPNALDACDIGAFEWNPPITKGKGPKP